MKVLMLFAGPKYDIPNEFGVRLEGCSTTMKGCLITTGPTVSSHKFGRFDVKRYRDPWNKSFATTFHLLFYGFLALYQARKQGEPYDLIVTYDPLKTGAIGVFLSKLFKTKLVVEVNGDYQNDVIYQEIKSRFKKTLKKSVFFRIQSFVLSRADGIKTLYPSQLDSFRHICSTAIQSSYEDFVRSSSFKWLEDKKEILFVGFPLHVKGVDILIEAFKRLSEKYPDWRLRILGYYPDRRELDSLIGEHEKIEYHPPVRSGEMPEFIGSCGIFALPSRTEAMGRVLIEAMACRKARVGSRVGGIPTVINDNADGLLFESENVDDLALKLDALMGDDVLRSQFAEKAFERWQSEFTEQHYHEKNSDFYARVIRKP